MINERMIVRITNVNKDLYVSNIQEAEHNSKQYQITLSERIEDAIDIEEKKDLEVIHRMFNINANYIRTTIQEHDISNLMWKQLEGRL